MCCVCVEAAVCVVCVLAAASTIKQQHLVAPVLFCFFSFK